MIAAIAVAGPLPAILDAIRIRERRREELVARLSAAKRAGATSSKDHRGTVIRPLLGGRIVLTPEHRSYRFEAPVSWGGLVGGLVDGFGATTTYPPGGP
jgi:hypothetical protein